MMGSYDETIFQDNECFYACEPMLTYFQDSDKSFNGIPAPKQVPMCASYCDAYFNACKNDRICFKDIITGKFGTNLCIHAF